MLRKVMICFVFGALALSFPVVAATDAKAGCPQDCPGK
jgi:hypothetical protein